MVLKLHLNSLRIFATHKLQNFILVFINQKDNNILEYHLLYLKLVPFKVLK